LFPVIRAAIWDTIAFSFPDLIMNLFSIPDLKVIYLNSDTIGVSFNPDFKVHGEELDRVFEEFIQEALRGKEVA